MLPRAERQDASHPVLLAWQCIAADSAGRQGRRTPCEGTWAEGAGEQALSAVSGGTIGDQHLLPSAGQALLVLNDDQAAHNDQAAHLLQLMALCF